ncbi:hypothetical protein D3C72_2023760 [compost metagenome]
MANLDRQAMFSAEVNPAQLVVLQAIPRSFDLDHPVTLLFGPELNQVGHAGAVALDIVQQTLETAFEVLCR